MKVFFIAIFSLPIIIFYSTKQKTQETTKPFKKQVDTLVLQAIADAEEFYKEESYKNALEIYKKIKKAGLETSYTMLKMGICEFYLEDYKSAIIDLTHSINLKPKSKKYTDFYFVGDYYFKSNNQYIFAKNFTSLQDSYSDIYYYRGIAKHYNLDNYGAVDDLKKLHSIKRDSTTISCYYLGSSLIEIKLLKECKRYFTYVINKKNNEVIDNDILSESYLKRGLASYTTSNKKLSCSDFSKASELGNERAFELISKLCK